MKRIYSSAVILAGCALLVNAEYEHDHSEQQHLIEQLNPQLGVVIDSIYYHENSGEGITHVKEELSGFGHGHGHEEHDHGQQAGFNLREVEIYLSGELDDHLRAEATLAFTAEDSELETAFVETTSLPWGISLKGGKFFSDFGIINAQHPHQWDFADQPLIYELALGDHGLNEVGVQAAWTLDSPLQLTAGVEALQGQNERMFAYEGEDPLSSHDGPRAGIAWLKAGPDLGHDHGLHFGASFGSGQHQEIHEEGIGTNNYLDGMSWFFGADALYQYSAHGEHGQGDFTLQAEYFYRNKNLDLEASDDPGAALGDDLDSSQDGYYVQALYGILPHFRGGLRWEQVGLTNEGKEPGEAREAFGDSWRIAAMLDFSPSAKSLIRVQASNGDYDTADGTENVWEAYVQLVITLGAHRHKGGYLCSGRH
ncbi:MAG: OprO/OprP family phosphate-selective porin [Pontiella sp.]|nr:OprO/OprP family phosphate-selective porin [Pontiella sp.]